MASRKYHFTLVFAVIALWCACIIAQDLETKDPAVIAGYIKVEPQLSFITCSEEETTVAIYLVAHANRTVQGNVSFGEYRSAAIPEHEGSSVDRFLGYILNSEQRDMYNSNQSDFGYNEGLACAPETVTYCSDGDNTLPRDTYCAVVFNPGDETLDLLFGVAWDMPKNLEGTEDENESENENESNDNENEDDGDSSEAPTTTFSGFPTYTAGIRDITASSASLSVTSSWFTISWFAFIVVAVRITVAIV